MNWRFNTTLILVFVFFIFFIILPGYSESIASKNYVDSKIIALPQSDWNQTNNTALDYIENKPDLTLKEDKSNKVISVSGGGAGVTSAGTDVQYPSVKAVYEDVVKNYGDESIDGVKTFTSIPQIPTASLPTL